MTESLTFRVLTGPAGLPPTLGPHELGVAYAWPEHPTVRANFITTLDGSTAGPDGLSGSLGNAADKAVFEHLRATCDAIVVGAGTVRSENYGPPPRNTLLVVASRRAAVPARLVDCRDVVLATTRSAGAGIDRAREALGEERVWVLGETDVSPENLRQRLVECGRARVLHEGGPSLFTQWLAARCIDELCLTIAPRLGDHGPRISSPLSPPIGLSPLVLMQWDATLLSRWALAARPQV